MVLSNQIRQSHSSVLQHLPKKMISIKEPTRNVKLPKSGNGHAGACRDRHRQGATYDVWYARPPSTSRPDDPFTHDDNNVYMLAWEKEYRNVGDA